MNTNKNEGILFDSTLSQKIKESFYHVDTDPVTGKRRLFFDNAGGSLRLKKSNDGFKKVDELPDCPEHSNYTAKWLSEIQSKSLDDIRIIFNARKGSIITSLTASMVIFEMNRAIIENIPGNNVVTTAIEHPSAYDSVITYAKKMGKEIRIANANKVTGGVDIEEVVKLIDKDTSLLSIIYASNLTGTVLDIEFIVNKCRKINPNLYIVIDSVQHMPHDIIDLEKTPVDGMSFAPYKFFGVRGFGIGYLSERAAKLPHNRLLAKPIEEWELGSPAPAQFSSVSEIVDYVCWIGSLYSEAKIRRDLYTEGMNRIRLHERALMYRMLNGSNKTKGLRNIEGIKVHFDNEDLSKRDLIVAIEFENINCEQAVKEYENRGIITFERVSTSLYSSRMLDSLGIKGVVRVSPIHCHDINDIDEFLNTTGEIAKI